MDAPVRGLQPVSLAHGGLEGMGTARPELLPGHRLPEENPYHEALVELAKNRDLAPQGFVHRLLETDAAVMGVDRVSYWSLTGSTVSCEDVWDRRTRRHDPGPSLLSSDYPSYFRALRESRFLAVEDALEDARTRELVASYLVPLGIRSLLDVPVYRRGEVVGIVCHEHLRARRWSIAEQEFAAAIADTMAIALETRDRERIQAALRVSEARLRLLTSRLPGILWTTDEKLSVTSAAGASLGPLGLAPSVLEGTSVVRWLDGTEPEARLLELHQRALQGESVEALIDRRGAVLEIHLEPWRDERGVQLGVIGLGLDVTARREIEAGRERLLLEEHAAREAAETARARAAFLAEASRAFGRTLDLETLLQSIAQQAVPVLADFALLAFDTEVDGPERSFRVTASWPERLDGQTLELLRQLLGTYRPDVEATDGVAQAMRTMRPVLHQPVTDAMLKGRDPIVSTRNPAHLALLRHLQIGAYLALPLVFDGRAVGALALARVRTRPVFEASEVELAFDFAQRACASVERAVSRRRLEEALQARDEFLSIAAHELYTPLTSLQLSLQGLKRSAEGQAVLDGRALGIAENQVRRLSRLVSELLDVSRTQNGQLELSPEDVDLTTLVRETLSQLEARAAEAHSTLSVHAREPVVGHWDRSRLEQVVTNLVSNAIKYGAGKPIEVHVEREGDEAVVHIEDHGIGIPADRVPHVWERFERAVSTQNYGGLGLGLYIVRRIVEAHGGQVQLRSVHGNGTIVTVRLPLSR